jgi:hypothetical protein
MSLRSWWLLLCSLLAVACGPTLEGEPVVDELTGQVLQEVTATYDMHRLLEDAQVRGGSTITVSQVQGFLQKKGSYLAGYRDPAWGNKSAATLIVERSLAHGISPLYMVTRIQVESSLITSGTSTNLSKATGCGCPDSGGCDASYAGFGNQVECGALKMRNYFRDLDSLGSTVSGWRVGVTKSTSDPCSVRPANKATAALYTYTPWVGAYGTQCGRDTVGGSSLVALVYNRFASEHTWGGTPTTAFVVDSDNARNDATKARFEASASWSTASSTAGYWGTGYAYASTQAVSDAAVFWFYLPAAGTRTLDAWWTAGSNRSATAPFVVTSASGAQLATVSVNQQLNGGRWNTLGTWSFPAGWNRVALSRWTTAGSVVVADALQVR